jgi:hypothetical protein
VNVRAAEFAGAHAEKAAEEVVMVTGESGEYRSRKEEGADDGEFHFEELWELDESIFKCNRQYWDVDMSLRVNV